MRTEKQPESFENLLLAHVELCYAVAFALTRDTDDARRLTQETVTQGWHMFSRLRGEKYIKSDLLAVLRARFIEWKIQKECALAERAEVAELH